MEILLVVVAYLLGSINVPILVGRMRGFDIRERDIAGTSGVFRQVGKGWGALVLLLELGKGAAAFGVSLLGVPWLVPLCGIAVVVGHIWPVFFGFRGGGGLAAASGFALAAFPLQTLQAAVVLAIGVAVYFVIFKKDRTTGLGSLPFAAIFAYLFLMWRVSDLPLGSLTILALIAPMAYRGALVLLGKWKR